MIFVVKRSLIFFQEEKSKKAVSFLIIIYIVRSTRNVWELFVKNGLKLHPDMEAFIGIADGVNLGTNHIRKRGRTVHLCAKEKDSL